MAGFWVCWFFLFHDQVCSWSSLLNFSVHTLHLQLQDFGLVSFDDLYFLIKLLMSFVHCFPNFVCLSVSSCIPLSYYVVFKFFIRQIAGLHFFGVSYCGFYYFSLVVFYLPDSSWSVKLPVGVCAVEGENTSYNFYRLFWQESSSVGFLG